MVRRERVKLSNACTWLNAISGEDDVSVQRKNRISWEGRLAGRITLVSNGLPNFGSGATALARRLIVFVFPRTVAKPDRKLTEKLMQELPGILNWSLDGYARLIERGEFLEPAASVKAKIRILHQADPVRGFVDDWCVIDQDAEIDEDLLIDTAWRHGKSERRLHSPM